MNIDINVDIDIEIDMGKISSVGKRLTQSRLNSIGSTFLI